MKRIYYSSKQFVMLTLLLFITNISFGQDQDISSVTATGENMVVCGPSVTFRIKVKNNTTQKLTSIVLYSGLPLGVQYEANSAQNMTILNTKPDSASFRLNDLQPLDSVIVSFKAKADCRLIDYIRSGSSSTSALANNKTRIDYTISSTRKTYYEPYGSSSYNVSYADIEVFVNQGETSQTPLRLNDYLQRHITIKNSGIGHAESLTFYVNNANEVNFKSLYLTDSTGKVIEKLSPISSQNNQFKYSLTNFYNIGDKDNLFEKNEKIYLLDSVSLKVLALSARTDYIVHWGCNSVECNSNDQEAEYSAYITLPVGAPKLQNKVKIVQKTELGSNTPSIIEITIKNLGQGNIPAIADGAYNFYFYEYSQYVNFDYKLFIKNTTTGQLIDLSKYIFQYYNGYGSYYRYIRLDSIKNDIDGVGGLSDLDNDNRFDDLAVGDSIVLIQQKTFSIHPSYNQTSNFTLTNFYTYATDIRKIQIYQGVFGYSASASMWTWSDVYGETNIKNGEIKSYSITSASQLSSPLINLPRQKALCKLIVPSGFVIQEISETSYANYLTKSRPFIQTGDTVTVDIPIDRVDDNNSKIGGAFTFKALLNCSKCTSLSETNPFKYYLYYSFDSIDVRTKTIQHKSESFKVLNNCLPCNSFETKSFSAERTTFGWVMPSKSVSYQDLMVNKTVPRANRNGTSINYIEPLDTFKLIVKSSLSVSNISYKRIHAEISADSLSKIPLFAYIKGNLVIGSNAYSFDNPDSVKIYFKNGSCYYDISIPLGTTGMPNEIVPGSDIELTLYFFYKPNTLNSFNLYTFKSLGALIYGIKDDGTVVKCNRIYNNNFSLIRNTLSYWGDLLSESCLQDIDKKLININSTSYYSNELRTHYYLRNVSFKLPEGFRFTVNQPVKFQGRWGYFVPDTVLVSSDRRNMNIPFNGKVMSDYFYIYVSVEVTPGYLPTQNYYYCESKFDYVDFFNYDKIYQSVQNVIMNHQIQFYKPPVSLSFNNIQEGYSNLVSWPVNFCDNTNSSDYLQVNAPVPTNSWTAVELKAEDNSTLLLGATDNSNQILPVLFYGPKDSNHPNGRHMLVKLGTVNKTSCKGFKINATYRNCENDRVQKLQILSSWNCSNYPSVSNSIDSITMVADSRNQINRGELSLRYKTANIQWNITKKAEPETELCESVPFDVNITSTKYADMNDVTLWYELPKGTSLDPQKRPMYSFPSGGVLTEIPATADTVSGTMKGWKLTKLTGGSLPGTRTNTNSIKVNMAVLPSCGFNPARPVKFRLTAKTNCNDLIVLDDQRKINILGIELDTLAIGIRGGVFSSCNTTNDVYVTLTNPEPTPSFSDMLEVVLPVGVHFIRPATSDTCLVKTLNDGKEHLYWPIPEGYIKASEAKTFRFPIKLVCTTFNFSDLTYHASTSVNKIAHCANGTSCNLSTTTGEQSLSVTYKPVLNVTPLCSENINSECRWAIKNISNEKITFNYRIDAGQASPEQVINAGDSVVFKTSRSAASANQLKTTYSYGNVVGEIVTNSIYKRCGNNIDCGSFDFDIKPQQINCPGDSTGSAKVIMPDLKLESYRWTNENDRNWIYKKGILDLVNVYAGRYNLKVIILDRNGNTCIKNKSVKIEEADLHVNLNTQLYNEGVCDKVFGVVKLNGVLEDTLNRKWYNCYDTATARPYFDLRTARQVNYNEVVTVRSGEIVKTDSISGFGGVMTITGGTVYVEKYFKPSKLIFAGGNIIIDKGAFFKLEEGLHIPVGASVKSYGVMEVSLIDVQGSFENYYKLACDTINVTGRFYNYEEAVIANNLENNSYFYNQGELEVFGKIINKGQLFNECTIYVPYCENNTTSKLSNGGFLELSNKLTNWSGSEFEIKTGSEIVCDTLKNEGSFSVLGDSCFCFTVFRLDEGSSIPPVSSASGKCKTNCRYASGQADNVQLLGENGQVVDSIKFLPGLHTIKIKLNDYCILEDEIYINGGLQLETNEYDTICRGKETNLICELNSEGEESIKATYNWTPTRGIINYDPTSPIQTVRPDTTTSYILHVTTKDGCTGTDTVTIVVINYKLKATLDKSSICASDSVRLIANVSHESQITWTPVTLLSSNDNGDTYVKDFENGGIYKYWATGVSEEYGCEATDTVSFTVNPLPKLTFVRSDSAGTIYCGKAEVEFRARGAEQYSWFRDDELFSSDSVITVTPTQPLTKYFVTGTNVSTNCSSTSQDEEVKVVQKPTISVGIDHNKCIIPRLQLTANGGSTYKWYPQTGLSDSTISNPTVRVSDTTLYYAEIKDNVGCKYKDSVIVYPILWPEAKDIKPICYGDTAKLSVTGGVPGTYAWTPSYAVDNAKSAEPTTNVKTTTRFVVEAEDEFGCKNKDTTVVYVDPTCRCSKITEGITYQWTGKINSDWTKFDNWSSGSSGRNAYPGLESTDNIIIDTAANRNVPLLDKDRSINNLCILGGKLNLGKNSLLIRGNATFLEGIIMSELTGNQKYGLIIADSIAPKSAYFGNVELNVPVKAQNCSDIQLNGSRFNADAWLEQSGNGITDCQGGNIYNGTTTIINSGAGTWRLAFNNGGKPDVYNGNVTFALTGIGQLYPTSSYTDTFKRDVKVNGKPLIFGNYGGKAYFNGNIDQFIGSDDLDNNKKPVFRKIEVDKNASLLFSKLVLDIPILIGLDTTDYIRFVSGYVSTDSTAALFINKNTRVLNCSDKGYVEGPVVKKGNMDFSFPIGGGGYYMPIRISGATKPDTSLMLYGEYIPKEQLLGPPVEPLTSVSTCEYWKLFDVKGRNDLNVNVTLSWSPVSCDVLTDVTKMQVATWDSLKWVGLGYANYTGTRITGGTLMNKESIKKYMAFVLASEIVADYGPTVGLSLNNYGVVLKIKPKTTLNVNGNILNDNGKVTRGKIDNMGRIHFKSDWTNNSTSDTVAADRGSYEMFGSFQRLRGSHPTIFSNLIASGHGRKELYADIFIEDTLYINDNNISTKRNSLHITNTSTNSLQRSTGYFSSSRFGGFLRRDIKPATGLGYNNKTYLFPVGNSYMYRPVTISPTSSYANTHTYSVRFLPYNPTIDTFNVDTKSATVKTVNNRFYHVIVRDSSKNDTLPGDPVNIRFYYNRATDGMYQSIGHWDNSREILPAPYIARSDSPIWKKATPVKIYVDSTDILTPHSLEIQNWSDFTSPNFALIQGAYVINTSKFGNPYYFNDQGIVYTMDGKAFVNKQPLYTTGHAETSMGQSISPEFFDSTEISNVMVIKGDAFSKPGKLEITTYADGTIVRDKKTGLYLINFIDDKNNKYPLSPDVYDVIEGTILVLKSTEDYSPNTCFSNIKVSFTNNSPLVFSKRNPGIRIENSSLISKFLIKDSKGTLLLEKNKGDLSGWTGADMQEFNEGIYKFTIEVVDKENKIQSFTGQFIITE